MIESEILKRKHTQQARTQLSQLAIYLVFAKTNAAKNRIFQRMKQLVEKSGIQPLLPLTELESKISA